MDASGVRNSWLTEPIKRLAQLVGLRAHARFADGVRDAEPLERGGGVGQHRIDADAQFVGALLRFAAKIDGDDAEFGSLRRHRAHEPDLAALGRHHCAGCRVAVTGRDLDHFGEDTVGHRHAGAPSAAV